MNTDLNKPSSFTTIYQQSNSDDIAEDLQLLLYKFICRFQKNLNYDKPTKQNVAIVGSLGKTFSTIIGGPGTGKTTTVFNILLINTLLKIYHRQRSLNQNTAKPLNISLLAPTGKAAQHLEANIKKNITNLQLSLDYLAKMLTSLGAIRTNFLADLEQIFTELNNSNEVKLQFPDNLDLKEFRNFLEIIKDLQFTPKLLDLLDVSLKSIKQCSGKTIHRGLGINSYNPKGNSSINGDIIIVDEVGMINLEIFTQFLDRILPEQDVILLGDKDQLPSIGLGYVLGNLSSQCLGYSNKLIQKFADFGIDNSKTELFQRYEQAQELNDSIFILTESFRYKGKEAIEKYANAINNPDNKTHCGELLYDLTINNPDKENQEQFKFLNYELSYLQFLELIKDQTQEQEQDSLSTSQQEDLDEDAQTTLANSQPKNSQSRILEEVSKLLRNQPIQDKDGLYSVLIKLLERYKISKLKSLNNTSNFQSLLKIDSQSETWRKFVNKQLKQLNPKFNLITNQKDYWQNFKYYSLGNFAQALILVACNQAFKEFHKTLDGLDRNNNDKLEQQLEQAFAFLKNNRFLCPLRQGELGVDTLNNLYINLFSNKKAKYNYAPVMITENQEELDIVNGDLGILIKTDISSNVYIYKQDKFRKIPTENIKNYEYAYFTTIHKAQGDEFNNTYVVLPLTINSFISKAMYYTGITRVKEQLTILGPHSLFTIKEFASDYRNTSLDFNWSN